MWMDINTEEYWDQELERLLENTRDCHEFQVYLQPKYELKGMEIVSAEALIRWKSATKGFLCPNDFIPFFERNGFIINSDFYVLEQVCKKIRFWLDQGVPPIQLSVNQSRVHISDSHYINRLSLLLEKYRIPKHLIELEITERLFMENPKKLLEVMEAARSLGFLISIDDFGSGYSSLNLLNQIPVDILKLDKAFLHNIKDERRSRIVITQIVEMAHQLDVKVVCEGVETKEQSEFLKEIKCDMVQGFFYARPMEINRFDAFRKA